MNKYFVIDDYGRIDINKWDDFVYNHPKGSVFQTSSFFRAMMDSIECKPMILIVVNESGAVVAVMQSLIYRDHRPLLRTLTARSIIEGGPLILNDDPTVLDYVLREYLIRIGKSVIYSQIRNSFNTDHLRHLYHSHGFKHDDHLNILVDLSIPEGELWANVHSKRKNEIRKALKEKVTFQALDFHETIDVSYSILEEVYNRAKLPLITKKLFISLFENLKGDTGLKVFNVVHESRIIGCMICLLYKNTIYDYYAGSFAEFYKKNPNDLLPWEVFRWAKINGFTIFDFGGAGHPDKPYGVRDYKKKFGGTIVNFGRYLFVHRPILYKLGYSVHQLIQKLK